MTRSGIAVDLKRDKGMRLMKIQTCLPGVLLAILSAAITLPAEAADSAAPMVKVSSGAIVGIVTNSAKLPVAHATVTAVKTDGGIRATVSGSDGVYSFADL